MTGQWQHVALGELLTESRARVVVESGRDYPICGVYGFGRGVLFRESIRGAETRSAHLYEVRAGQIIYSRLKAFEGAFALVPPAADGWYVSNEFPTFDVDKQRACPDFLRLVLALPATWRNMAERITGVGARRERLKVSDFLGFELDLPPLDEQWAMVSAVTTVDAAIMTGTAERAAAFGLLDAERDALSVPTGTWDELPKQWVMRTLGDVADVRTGIAKGRITEKETRPHPFLRAANVQNGFLDLAEIKDIDVTADEAVRFALRSGDVLMVEGSGSPDRLGRGWVWDGEVERCIHQNHVFRARPDTSLVLSRFLAHLLAATPVRAYFRAAAKTTSGLSTINSTQTRALPIPCPPLEQQQRIADMLDAVRATAVAVHREQKQLLSLRTALVESMLSGAWPRPQAVLQLVSA